MLSAGYPKTTQTDKKYRGTIGYAVYYFIQNKDTQACKNSTCLRCLVNVIIDHPCISHTTQAKIAHEVLCNFLTLKEYVDKVFNSDVHWFIKHEDDINLQLFPANSK